MNVIVFLEHCSSFGSNLCYFWTTSVSHSEHSLVWRYENPAWRKCVLNLKFSFFLRGCLEIKRVGRERLIRENTGVISKKMRSYCLCCSRTDENPSILSTPFLRKANSLKADESEVFHLVQQVLL